VLRDASPQLPVDLPVEQGDAAKRRDRIGGERALPGLLDRPGDGDAARVRVLDDHDGRHDELAQHAACPFEIDKVVVRELLAAELLHLGKQVAACADLAVIGARLVRVLAVGEVGHLPQRKSELLRERLGVAEPVRDRGFVHRTRLERFAGEPPARIARRIAVLAQLGQYVLILRLVRHDSDVREVLGGGPQHRGAADIDHLHDLRLGLSAFGCDRSEGIEVDADEVDRLDLVLCERVDVLGQVAPREDPGVDARVQRLDAAAEHLGRLRHVLDGRDCQPLLLEKRGRATGRDELPAELGQGARERVDAVLVVDADQCAARQRSLTTSGSNRCSTA
jgi:hypothetical protein